MIASYHNLCGPISLARVFHNPNSLKRFNPTAHIDLEQSVFHNANYSEASALVFAIELSVGLTVRLIIATATPVSTRTLLKSLRSVTRVTP